MELIEKINHLIDKTKKEEMLYEVPETMLEKIHSAKKRTEIVYEMLRIVKDIVEQNTIKGENILQIFIGSYKKKSLKIYDLKTKKKILNEIKNVLYEIKIGENHYEKFFKNQMIKPKNDKLKRVVQGKTTEAFQWIEKKEEMEVVSNFYEITLLAIEKSLEIPNKKRTLQLYELLISINDNPYSVHFNLRKAMKENMIQKLAENEETDEIKKYLKIWYQDKGKGTTVLLDLKEEHYTEAREYFYLFHDLQKERVKEKIMKMFEEEFETYKEYTSYKRIDALENLKKKTIDVKEWC